MTRVPYEARGAECPDCGEELIGFRVDPLAEIDGADRDAEEALVQAMCIECDDSMSEVGTVPLPGTLEADEVRGPAESLVVETYRDAAPSRSEPADFGGGESTGVQDL